MPNASFVNLMQKVLNFLLCQYLLRKQEKIFYTYFGPKVTLKSSIVELTPTSEQRIMLAQFSHDENEKLRQSNTSFPEIKSTQFWCFGYFDSFMSSNSTKLVIFGTQSCQFFEIKFERDQKYVG